MKELKNYVDSIAQDLRKLYDADFSESEREEMENDGQPFDLWSYFDDALDIEYVISGNGDFRGCIIAVTLGGPNVYVDTRHGIVDGYWGSDHETAWIPVEICDEINYLFEDTYRAMI